MSEARFAAEPGFCVHATNVSGHPAWRLRFSVWRGLREGGEFRCFAEKRQLCSALSATHTVSEMLKKRLGTL
jgi:hypothetical protein